MALEFTWRKILGAFFCAAAIFAAISAKADEPKKLNIAVVIAGGLESGWDKTLIDSLVRVKAQKPHGLDITWKVTDPLWGDSAGEAIRLFAESGKYDIIWAHNAFSDQVQKIKAEYPNLMFVVSGSGNVGLGGNQYWVYKRVHEPAYLLGIIAGRMTKTNTIAVVGTMAADDINDEVNAFFLGAKSVNPAVKRRVAFIESWYDPAKASEFTEAQIATGADVVFQLASNFKPCENAKILCFGNHLDEASFSPSTVVSGTLIRWDPDISKIVDAWFTVKSKGVPFDGNKEKYWIGMQHGGSDMTPYHEFEAKLPEAVRSEVAALKAKIMSGQFEVPLDVSTPKSDP